MRTLATRAAPLLLVTVLVAACSSGGETVLPFDETAATTTAIPSEDGSTTSVPSESIEDFMDGVVGAYRTGNPVFLVQRIHPDLREYYGQEACRTLYQDFVPDDSANVTIRSVTGPVQWSETFDGVDFVFDDVYTVDVEFVDFGATRRQDTRLARIDDRLYLFVDCGEPLAAATTTTINISRLDPDGDGLFYVHSGPGDSEDFAVPEMFRITYTGSASTCALQIMDSETGREIRYVTGLDGGGIKRIVMSEPLTTVYLADMLGCDGGDLEVGPNP